MLKRLLKIFKSEIWQLPSRTILFIGCIFIVLLPLFTQEPFFLRIVIMACIFAIYAASWDLLSGFAGQLSLGHALFFGVGAYITAFLNIYLNFSPWLSIPLGALVAVAVGLIGGIPSLRLKGIYLSLVTLALPIILTSIVFAFPEITGGELGLWGVDRLASTRTIEYYLVLIVMLISCFAMWKIVDSKIGIVFHAIRGDEIAARASGINTTKFKLIAFSLSGFFAGLSGGLLAHFLRIAGPSTLELMTSFQPIIWTIFGSVATIYGAVVGTFILYPIMEVLQLIPGLRMLIYGLIVLIILRFMPSGIVNWVVDRIENECPRCKNQNAKTRKQCRICNAKIDH